MLSQELEIGFSWRLTALLVLLHLGGLPVILATDIPVSVKSVFLMLVLVSLSYRLGRDVFHVIPGAWTGLQLEGDVVTIVSSDGWSYGGVIERKTTIVCPWLVLVRIRIIGKRYPVSRIIFPDALKDNGFRQLCLYLRFAWAESGS